MVAAAAQMTRKRGWCPSIFQRACCFFCFFFFGLENWKMKKEDEKERERKGKALGGKYICIYRFPAPLQVCREGKPHHPLWEQRDIYGNGGGWHAKS